MRVENAGAESCLQGDIEQRNQKGHGWRVEGRVS